MVGRGKCLSSWPPDDATTVPPQGGHLNGVHLSERIQINTITNQCQNTTNTGCNRLLISGACLGRWCASLVLVSWALFLCCNRTRCPIHLRNRNKVSVGPNDESKQQEAVQRQHGCDVLLQSQVFKQITADIYQGFIVTILVLLQNVGEQGLEKTTLPPMSTWFDEQGSENMTPPHLTVRNPFRNNSHWTRMYIGRIMMHDAHRCVKSQRRQTEGTKAENCHTCKEVNDLLNQ